MSIEVLISISLNLFIRLLKCYLSISLNRPITAYLDFHNFTSRSFRLTCLGSLFRPPVKNNFVIIIFICLFIHLLSLYLSICISLVISLSPSLSILLFLSPSLFLLFFPTRGRGSSAVERATPSEEVPGSTPPVAARSLLVRSVSV